MSWCKHSDQYTIHTNDHTVLHLEGKMVSDDTFITPNNDMQEDRLENNKGKRGFPIVVPKVMEAV